MRRADALHVQMHCTQNLQYGPYVSAKDETNSSGYLCINPGCSLFYRFHFLIPKHISYIYSLCSQYSDSLLIVVQTAGGLERNRLYCCHNKTIPTIKQLLSILVYFLVKG